MKKTLSYQIHSFYCAIRGILLTFITESHMRFHLVAAVYVVYFYMSFYQNEMGTTPLLVLLLIIACVMASEVINTSIETLADAVTKDYNENIRDSKDSAAGSVLLFSIIAVVIACFVFIDTDIIFNKIIPYFLSNITSLVILITTAVMSVLFVVVSPKRYLSPIKKLFSKKD